MAYRVINLSDQPVHILIKDESGKQVTKVLSKYWSADSEVIVDKYRKYCHVDCPNVNLYLIYSQHNIWMC